MVMLVIHGCILIAPKVLHCASVFDIPIYSLAQLFLLKTEKRDFQDIGRVKKQITI
jgi:hypothetical protein